MDPAKAKNKEISAEGLKYLKTGGLKFKHWTEDALFLWGARTLRLRALMQQWKWLSDMLTTQFQSSSTTDLKTTLGNSGLKTAFSMGFLSSIIGATVKTVLTPVAVVKDAVNIVSGESPDSTKELLESIVNDLEEGFDGLGDGEVL